jgi:hypothetical protein
VAFNGPTFNIECGIWRLPSLTTAPPDRVSVCNLSLGKRMDANQMIALLFLGGILPGQDLLLPAGTDIAGYGSVSLSPPFSDVVECPLGSGRFYVVVGVVDVGSGFGNAYRMAYVMQNTQLAILETGNPWGAPAWPVPTP